MSITEKLREYAEDWDWLDMSAEDAQERLEDIADRIDAEHEKAMAAAALIAGVPITDENMAEHGWVRGPLDADGKMWRSGDMSDSNWGVIEGIAYEDGRWLISGHDMSAPWIPADSIRHHHEPTVEDVLRSVVTLCHNTWKEESPFHFYDIDDVMKSGNIAEFAAKLRPREATP